MKHLLLIAILLLSQAALANQPGWSCWKEAADRYKVPVDLLYAIARVESGNRTEAINRNPDGSYDIGVMQINSSHLSRLKKYGITAVRLLTEPCLNVHVGAWILSDAIARFGYTWKAIGAYNAASDSKRIAYAKKVYAMYARIQQERTNQG